MTDSVSSLTSRLSTTVKSVPPSGIRKFFDLAANMEGVISLGVGEPDFSTPWAIREAGVSSLERGRTSYTANAGLYELREKIATYFERKYHVQYDPETEMIVTVGASEGLDLAIRSIVDPGDEVIIVEPNFVSYAPLVTLAGGKPIPVKTTLENRFVPLTEAIEQAITPKTKAVLTSFPNNPTGTVLTAKESKEICDVIKRNDLLLISDEIYAELSYDAAHTSMASVDGMRERTILISGLSKAFAMTGWRMGYVCAPSVITQAMLKIHQYAIMCAPSTAQYAALAGFNEGLVEVEEMVETYKQRRNFFVTSMREIGLDCHQPGGAFYAFPSIKKTGYGSEEFAQKLLEGEQVAVVPGHVFGEGGEGHIRCSYASSMKQLQTAVERIDRFVNRNSKS
ncbi:aminotransferase [Texcoconibacillus texcoconensis]|uniref:Aminotransferase n=1 Tax=Texcoconibacillus texcoconensis TaxID=1095777 RepID=A0A840QND9_9BACI|nr:aminotransferase [Texcoconibacillus texcoconensis]MBB5172860.1 aminotransferase [Texcoconibacillus texcoconensis]